MSDVRDQIADLVDFLASELASDADAVEVRASGEDDRHDLYEISVNQQDLGQLIGRQGRTARAMRAVVKAAAAKHGRRAHVEILE
ncbi:MAG: KH domain-containing protein [Myxococcales bacterium]|nr:KH domain-containing protein [Myxococcales bacterium]MCB9733050.1 KH domain-containing protein [Deltaproteobacteria bacterium]